MRNAWRIYVRDLRRLGKVPLAWVIIGGALITPALYAWLNIVAFWNPFDNTKNLSIAVVNLDEGAYNEMTGVLNVGDQLVAQLKDNDDLGWHFLSEDEAMRSVKSGESFAAFVVPETFSEDLLSITTGKFTKPELLYYVNEKLNGVAPEITDTGATTIQTQMIDSFTEQVASAAASAVQSGGKSAEQGLKNESTRTTIELNLAAERVSDMREHLATFNEGITTARAGLQSSEATLADMETTFSDLQVVLNDATTLADQAQAKLLEFTAAASTAYVNSISGISRATADASLAVSDLTQGIGKAQSRLETQISVLTEGIDGLTEIEAAFADGRLPANPGVEGQLATLKQQLLKLRTDLERVDTGLGDGAAAVQGAANAANAAFQEAANAARAVNSALTTHVPALQRPMAQLTAAAHTLSATLSSQQTILAEARQLTGGLDDQLASTSAAISSLDSNLEALSGDMRAAVTDLSAVSSAAAWKQLSTLTSLDPEQIGNFMATPVEVKQHTLFKTNSYGSLMGSLFINLSLWIGAFVLVVILKLEVDKDGVKDTTERERYMGRWLLFASIAVAQAIVLSIGNLLIGVQHVNTFAFVITPVIIGLSYLSIIYALSVTFGYIGRGLCVVLVIMQIPGASGIYPIELMPQFFQSLYPLFPFTYGIDAMREVVSGFAGFAYWRYLGMLMVYVALAFFLGLVLRNSFANLTRLLTQKVDETELFTTESGTPSGPGYRLSHMLRVLSNRAAYEAKLNKKTLAFARSYKKVRAALVTVGVLVGVLIIALGAFIPEHKTALVGWWIVWLLVIFAALTTLEYIRYSLRLSTEVGNMPDDEIRKQLEHAEAKH